MFNIFFSYFGVLLCGLEKIISFFENMCDFGHPPMSWDFIPTFTYNTHQIHPFMPA